MDFRIEARVNADVAAVPCETRAKRLHFSPFRCFHDLDARQTRRCLAILAEHLESRPGTLAFLGQHEIGDRLLEVRPTLAGRVTCWLTEDDDSACDERQGIPVVPTSSIPAGVSTVFLCETEAYALHRMRRSLSDRANIVTPEVLPALAWTAVPESAWIEWEPSIYPIDLPEMQVRHGLDLLLVDCPAKNMGLLPNGLGYVHNALEQSGVRFQTLDIDIIMYHRFHMARILDGRTDRRTPAGEILPEDPWLAEHSSVWERGDTIEFFRADFEQAVRQIVAARPKILGLSVHEANQAACAYLVERVREQYPDVIVLAGGYNCLDPATGLKGFPQADYMVIGEADLTVGPIVKCLLGGPRPTATRRIEGTNQVLTAAVQAPLKGNGLVPVLQILDTSCSDDGGCGSGPGPDRDCRTADGESDGPPANLVGALSRYDSPDHVFQPGPIPNDVDALGFPKYQWADTHHYRNYNGYQLTPVLLSRGCRWSKCTFCTERFFWRIRTAESFVAELEWLYEHGCDLFMLNDSDLNGSREILVDVCDEVRRRGLPIRLTGQMRVDKKNTPEFFERLHAGGFVAMRFGVDAWSTNTLKTAKKGYTPEMACATLKMATEAGLFTEVNMIVGYPGESDDDVGETIRNIVGTRDFIGRFAVLNPLMLKAGSPFWEDYERYKIRFRRDPVELKKQFPMGIPASLWYSEEPYIDEKVRNERVKQVLIALHEGGVRIGPVAAARIEEMCSSQDEMRGSFSDDNCSTGFYESGPRERSQTPLKPDHSRIVFDGKAFYRVPMSLSDELAALLQAPADSKGILSRIAESFRKLGPGHSHRALDRIVQDNRLRFYRQVPDRDITLVAEGIEGYNVIYVSGRYLGLKQGYPLDFSKIDNGEYPADICIHANSVIDVCNEIGKRAVDQRAA